ncbi:phytoene desaturase family protein [Stratiformator vulcanicus]|uniref:All-trans-zeta-carotene desaturase n=1 Tax=Stratiformator vulcanicus TaxID=2527980 RepID=A0A517R602_9PLAN|nr:phytoene desaturase family protein [Stratiformator vulcanicus]QDT39292.1 All-trans-zeta-carotene desaturase [Stratiformator vulcanicus]
MTAGPNHSRNRAPKVIIAGAGPGGLAAAMLLRHAGCQVSLYERRPSVGGRTSSIRAEGFRFDCGPTFFLYPRVLQEVFSAVGRDLADEVPMARLDPQYRLIFGQGGQLDATRDVEKMERQIASINPRDVGNFERYLTENRHKLEKFRPALESPFSKLTDLMSPGLIAALPVLRPWLSVDGDLKRYFKDQRLRIAFSFQSKYLGMSPFRCPSLFSILAFLEYEHGVWHPYGGCGQISERMAEIAVEMGVELHTAEPIEEILFDGRKAVGVKTASGEESCDALVINADFARAMQRLVPDTIRRRWTDRKIEKKEFSCSTYMMYLGIEGLEEQLQHHTIYISENYDRNLREIESDHVLSDDPSVYVQNAGITDDSLAPKGCSTLYVLAPVTHQHPNVDWSVEKDRFRKVVMRQLAHLGIENLEKRIRFEKIITPADWDTDYEIHIGATFNLAHSLKQMLHLRPRNRFEDLDGVYLVGGGTHPGSGLPVIYESARITSRLLCGDFGLEFPETDEPPALISRGSADDALEAEAVAS